MGRTDRVAVAVRQSPTATPTHRQLPDSGRFPATRAPNRGGIRYLVVPCVCASVVIESNGAGDFFAELGASFESGHIQVKFKTYGTGHYRHATEPPSGVFVLNTNSVNYAFIMQGTYLRSDI